MNRQRQATATRLDATFEATILDRLDCLTAEVQRLAAAIERDHRRPQRKGLVPAIAVAFPGRSFNAADIIEAAASNAALAAALDRARFSNARALGRFLVSIEARTIGALRVRRIGESRNAAVWVAEPAD